MTLASSLAVYYELENTNDGIGANNLTNNGGATFNTGLIGNAVYLTPASSQYLSLANTAAVQTGDIDYWIQAKVWLDIITGFTFTFPMIVTKDNDASNREYALFYDTTAARFAFAIYKSGGTAAQVTATAFGAPAANTWYHLIGYHNSVLDTVNLVVNDTTPASAATGGAQQAAGTAQFQIGNRQRDARYWPGRIDGVLLGKNHIPTASDITFLYNGGVTRTLAEIQALDAVGQPTMRRAGLVDYMGHPLEMGRKNVKVF